MALFDEKHKKQMEENGRRLRENLARKIAEPVVEGSIMSIMGHNFAKNLLNDLNNRKVIK